MPKSSRKRSKENGEPDSVARKQGLRERNIAIFRRYIELENARDYARIEELFHPTQFVCPTWFGDHPIAPRALTRMLRGLFQAFPDWYMTINEIIAADEHSVVGRITGRGTQYDEFMKQPAADHQIAIPLLHSIRVANGRIVEYRATNPFEDPFRADIVIPDDVQAVRAQQGYDSNRVQELFEAAKGAGHVGHAEVARLEKAHQTGASKCQALLRSNMRRCSMDAQPGELYCKHHLLHGYGIDRVE